MAEAKKDRTYVSPLGDSVVKILDYTKRTPAIEPRDPNVIYAEEPPDPDAVVADWLFGKGTGDLKKDLAIGLAGGAAGPILEASGHDSGVLDWVPGGTAGKALVTAAIMRKAARNPELVAKLASQASRAASRMTLDEMKEIASRKPPYINKDAWLRKNGIDPKDFARKVAQESDWKANGWKSADHPNSVYDKALPRNATEEDRRMAFVADSLAKEVLKDFVIRGADSDIDYMRHKMTNYDRLWPKFNRELKENFDIGQLQNTDNIRLNPMPDGRGMYINDATGAGIYDAVFRRLVNDKLRNFRP